MKKVAIVTGGGSGIGLETARALSKNGYSVYDFSRTDRKHEFVYHISCDVAREEDVLSAVKTVIEKEGKIDLLINNAGMGISGCVEFTDPDDAMRLMNVNLFGCDRVTRACLAHMRGAGEGKIIFISSAAAVFPIPFQTWYSLSKSAVNAYALALRNEVRPFGISVCAVMPGDIKTGFTDARKKAHKGDDVYNGRISRAVETMEKDERNGMDSAYAGKFISRIALKRRIKPMYVLGNLYRVYAAANRFLPCGIMNLIVGKMYGGF